jgi:hypothetical protein
VALGLETLDLAKIHEAALLDLIAPPRRRTATLFDDASTRRLSAFFIEAITPIEEAHQGAREANVKLAQRTKELAPSNEELKCEVRRRKASGSEHAVRRFF